MPIVRWSPSVPLSQREQFLVGRMVRTGKLFAFLRKSRHQLFDDAFQAELEAMYADSVGGKPPVAPALLAMVILLQAYTRASDAQAVELSIVDARWQMVLDVIGEDESPFSQGALSAFRRAPNGARTLVPSRASCDMTPAPTCPRAPCPSRKSQ